MQARLKPKPEQKEIVKTFDLCGFRLVCIRRHYNEELQVSLKTVELIVEIIRWTSQPEQVRPDAIVGVQVKLQEVKLQKQLRQACAKWNCQFHFWEIRCDQASTLDLAARI